MIKGYKRIRYAIPRQLQEPPYSNNCSYTILFGFYQKDGLCLEEVKIHWTAERNKNPDFPTLIVNYSHWKTLAKIKDLMTELGRYGNQRIQKDNFCEILNNYGFVEISPEEIRGT